MQNKLERLYNDCIKELKSIKIDITNPLVGDIDIRFSKGNPKRYGCCKQEDPDKDYYHIVRKGKNISIKYDRFKKHHIEISKWVMSLNDEIIKNTIMHEIIHCFPGCNNHQGTFKSYANYINQKLGYDISRLGNREADYRKSNIEYNKKTVNYKYKIICQKCGQVFYRQRMKKNLIKHYRCSKCGGKLELLNN